VERATGHSDQGATGAQGALQTGLWVGALALTLWMAYLRWRTTAMAPIGTDFEHYLAAAKEVAAGKSPYLIQQYVYPPTLALLLAPFSHASTESVWKFWTAFIVGAPLVGIAAFVSLIKGRNSWWLRPAALALCGCTMFDSRYYPLTRDLVLGQSDTVLFSVIAVSAVAASKGASRLRGGMIGLAGLIKVWPWATALSVMQPGVKDRLRTLVFALAVICVAPATALIFGWSGLSGFITNDFHARQQNLVSDSVWSIPPLLFSHSGMAKPIAVSTPLHLLLTAVLAAWVITLLAVAVRTASDGALGTWNVTFCIILLLPVSHRQYAICVLPILWWWVVLSVTTRAKDWRVLAVSGLLVIWWLDQNLAWPYNGMSHSIAALRFSVPFVGNLIACTVSVAAARYIDTSVDNLDRSETTGELPDRLARASLTRSL